MIVRWCYRKEEAEHERDVRQATSPRFAIEYDACVCVSAERVLHIGFILDFDTSLASSWLKSRTTGLVATLVLIRVTVGLASRRYIHDVAGFSFPGLERQNPLLIMGRYSILQVGGAAWERFTWTGVIRAREFRRW